MAIELNVRATLCFSGACLLIGLLSACNRDSGGFQVIEILPSPSAEPLRLNQVLTIVFSEDVDPSSVSPGAIQIRLADGQPAQGRLETAGSRVRFHPAPVQDERLTDGGYREGGGLSLTLPGFPSRSGVFSGTGDPLQATSCYRLQAVSPSGGPPSGFFVDVDGGAPPRLLNRLTRPGEGFGLVRPGGRIRLWFSEPLLPACVHSESIRLFYDNPDRDPVESQLTFEQGESDAVVELSPAGGFLQDGARYLLVLGGVGVRDLVGNGYDPTSVQEVRIRVDALGDEILGGSP